MPLVDLDQSNKIQQQTEYPKLSLEYGERALINAIEQRPTMEYVHPIQMPALNDDGTVLKEVRQNAKNEDYEAVVYEFVGQHLCFGDFNTVHDKGIDPDNCPTCRASVEEDCIKPPIPKYGMHVIQYSTQPGSWELRDPYNVNLVVWTFAPNKFNTIVDLATEWGDLRDHDLKLGPCESKKFQKFDINVSKIAQWRSGADEKEKKYRAEMTIKTYKQNQADDLAGLIGRRVSKDQALEDIQTAVERYAQAYGRKPSAATVAADVPSKPTVSEPVATKEETNPVVDEKPEKTSKPTKAEEPTLDTLDMEDLLGSLG